MWRKAVSVALITMMGITFTGCPQNSGPTPGQSYHFPSVNWQRGHRIEEMSGGGFFIAGDASYGDSVPRVLGVKLDADRSVIWASDGTAPFTRSVYDISGLAFSACDGSVTMAGLDMPMTNSGTPVSHLRIMQVNETGDVLWDNTYGEQSFVPRAALELTDGQVAIAAYNNSWGVNRAGLYLRLPKDGSSVEVHELSPESFWPVTSIICSDGGVAVAGLGGIPNVSTSTEFVVVKLAADGIEQWQKIVDINGNDDVTSLAEAPNGDFVLAGTHGEGLSFVRISPDGEVVWVRDDIFPDTGPGTVSTDVWDVDVSDTGDIVFVGHTERWVYLTLWPISVTYSNYIALLDGNGDVRWKTTVGDARLYGVTATAEGTFMATGNVGTDLVLIEVDSEGNVLN